MSRTTPVTTSDPPTDAEQQAVEERTQELGRTLWSAQQRSGLSIFDRRWWDDKIMDWAMDEESIKIQMFRFVDVLPMLKGHESVVRHLQEYFEEVRTHLPWAVRLGMDLTSPNGILSRALAWNARSNARRMASRFIAGSTVEEVSQTVLKLRKQGYAFSLDLLGEAVISDVEADRYRQAYLDLITGLAPTLEAMPEQEQIDRDALGPIPRMNCSVKLSALTSQFRPVDAAGTSERVKERLRPLLRTAMAHDTYIHFDMEHYHYKDLTLRIFREILMEEEFRSYPHFGIVIQAYLPEAEEDLIALRDWADERGTPVTVRLVKGAYWDYETVIAKQHGWPIPVYQQKWESDENFERQAAFLMRNWRTLKPALGSHNLRSLAASLAWAEHYDVPDDGYEVQVLFGMGEELAELFGERGTRVRVYTPFGELIPGMAYLVRRLLENTSNDSFLKQGRSGDIDVDLLLRAPTITGQQRVTTAESTTPSASPTETDAVSLATAPIEFTNEPLTDFAHEENREAFSEALDEVRDQLGEEYPIVIDGKTIRTSNTLLSRNPSRKKEVVGTVYSAGEAEAQSAIAAARRAFKTWCKEPVKHRAEYLELIAAEMRKRKFELAAWIVFECGKPWAEADGDVAEAIDFCDYYAAHMRQIDEPMDTDVPGEENVYFYRPRGVAVVISPWNFPLAILTGMTVAALVTGNTVIMKPAEQSSVIAAKLMEIMQSIGLPDGVANFLPGVGEEVGPVLVESPEVDLIAFTGSREVGLLINRQAAETTPEQTMVKRVIAEMGGKNAIIIDEDADLDEAVQGVIDSAFGFAGQKCSACSRAIVLESVAETFLERLLPAVESLIVAEADDPAAQLGPVIDEESQKRITKTIKQAEKSADDDGPTLAYATDVKTLAKQGHFVGPHVFTNVDPSSDLAQNEIFGPVLAVITAPDLDEAIAIANGTDYALTAGVYSRSPANLKRAAQELRAGNIYLNRGITGALVARQPFGGFRMSGIGTKAGGPDYLYEFLIPVNVTENTLRRGFAPPEEEDGGTEGRRDRRTAS